MVKQNKIKISTGTSTDDDLEQNSRVGGGGKGDGDGIPSVIYERTVRVYNSDEDGTEAWCIVMCCFLVNVIVMGFLKCLGILIIELQKAFKATPADVSILVSITSGLNCIAGPLACYLVVKFSARTIAFTGTSLVALGLCLSWFATSILYLYFTIGVLVGFGSGLTYSPGVILIGNHFQKRSRGMANGVVVSGSPVGGMIMPYMLNFLIQYLDCQGALLILGGLMLNAVVCTLSYRPYKKRKSTTSIIQVSGSSKDLNLQTKRTIGSLHLPILSSTTSSLRRKVTASESDDSSGPEFIEDDNSPQKLRNASTIIHTTTKQSSGSVIVYRINETYGKSWNFRDGVTRRNKKSQRPPNSNVGNKPPYWPIDSNSQKLSDEKSSSSRPQLIDQNVESKQSQTEIHSKSHVPPHPFSHSVRLLKNTTATSSSREYKISQISGSGMAPASKKGIAITLSSGTSTNDGGGNASSAETSLRNRRNLKRLKDNSKDLQSSSRKISPYILSLDHSCVIMWSNDNLAKGQGQGHHGQCHGSHSGGGASVIEPELQELLHKPKGGDHGDSVIVLGAPGAGGSLQKMEQEQKPKKKDNCCLRIISWIKKSPLANGMFIILLISNSSTAIATTNILLLIPALGEYRGLTKSQYSTVYLIISMMDLTGRLLGSFIYDRGYLNSKTIFASGLGFAGLSSLLIAIHASSMLSMCLLCAMFGLACGFHIGIFGALLAEIVGVEVLHVGYALCMILNGVLQFTFIFVSGKILSMDPDAFFALYIFYGVVLLFGSSLWLFPFLHGRLHGRRMRMMTMKGKNKSNVELSNSNRMSSESNLIAAINSKTTAKDTNNRQQPINVVSNISL